MTTLNSTLGESKRTSTLRQKLRRDPGRKIWSSSESFPCMGSSFFSQCFSQCMYLTLESSCTCRPCKADKIPSFLLQTIRESAKSLSCSDNRPSTIDIRCTTSSTFVKESCPPSKQRLAPDTPDQNWFRSLRRILASLPRKGCASLLMPFTSNRMEASHLPPRSSFILILLNS